MLDDGMTETTMIFRAHNKKSKKYALFFLSAALRTKHIKWHMAKLKWILSYCVFGKRLEFQNKNARGR